MALSLSSDELAALRKLIGNKPKKITKKDYLNTIKKNSTSYENFFNDMELPESCLDVLVVQETVGYYTQTIMNYIEDHSWKEVPIFCPRKKNGKYFLLLEDGKWKSHVNIKPIIKIVAMKTMKVLKIWENENPNFLFNPDLTRDFHVMIAAITGAFDENESKHITDAVHKLVYKFHKKIIKYFLNSFY